MRESGYINVNTAIGIERARERERERERGGEGEREKERERGRGEEKKREKERGEREGGRVREGELESPPELINPFIPRTDPQTTGARIRPSIPHRFQLARIAYITNLSLDNRNG